MFQTWPSHEAYMADVRWQNDREALIRRYSLETCDHGRSMTSGCDQCGEEAAADRPSAENEQKEARRDGTDEAEHDLAR